MFLYAKLLLDILFASTNSGHLSASSWKANSNIWQLLFDPESRRYLIKNWERKIKFYEIKEELAVLRRAKYYG